MYCNQPNAFGSKILIYWFGMRWSFLRVVSKAGLQYISVVSDDKTEYSREIAVQVNTFCDVVSSHVMRADYCISYVTECCWGK